MATHLAMIFVFEKIVFWEFFWFLTSTEDRNKAGMCVCGGGGMVFYAEPAAKAISKQYSWPCEQVPQAQKEQISSAWSEIWTQDNQD